MPEKCYSDGVCKFREITSQEEGRDKKLTTYAISPDSPQSLKWLTDMIEHIVLFKWKNTATPEQIEAVLSGLKQLKSQIPSIVDLSCGENFSPRSQGFQHGLVVRFEDKAGLEAYQLHPAHQEVVQKLIKPILADIIAIDYEIY